MERFKQISDTRWLSLYSQILLDGKGKFWWFTKNRSGDVECGYGATYDEAKMFVSQMNGR